MLRKLILGIYHFLGGVYFAIILLVALALFVIAGTVLESMTGSHRYATEWTYSSLAFTLLICCLFINILFASLRRWPFRLSHLPFLITHLGLLMLLMGVLVKSFFGIQGQMVIEEGSGSHELILPDAMAVVLTPRQGVPVEYRIERGRLVPPHQDLELLAYYPNSKQRLELLWNKQGLNEHDAAGLPALTHQIYIEGKRLVLREAASARTLMTVPLEEALESFYMLDDGFGGYAVRAELPQTFMNASLLSAYLQSDGLYSPEELLSVPRYLYCPIRKHLQPCEASSKPENDAPMVKLRVGDEEVVLGQDSRGLHWPLERYELLASLQPARLTLPYHVFLRQARKISYPNSTQPYSYEADLLINNREATISMNNVFETSDGYRFYLATMSSGEKASPRQIQLIVNHDPAKYILTYPGGAILSLGIVLLLSRPRRKDD